MMEQMAIRNFKAHFLSVLAGTATSFPPNLWDRLLTQAKVTINLLQRYFGRSHQEPHRHGTYKSIPRNDVAIKTSGHHPLKTHTRQ